MGSLLSVRQLYKSSIVSEKILGLQDSSIPAPEARVPWFWLQGISGPILLRFLRCIRSADHGSLVSTSECIRMKIIGKPYSGKPNVRFDEGELEIELMATMPALYSTEVVRQGLARRCLSTQIPFNTGQKERHKGSKDLPLTRLLTNRNPG